MRLSLLMVACLALGCTPDVKPDPVAADGGVEVCDYGCLPPTDTLYGQGFSTWASPICAGVFARGPTSGPAHRTCAVWTGTGKVYCANYQAPVTKIYYVDPNDGVCKEWTTTVEDWYEWPEISPVPESCKECTCDCPYGPPPPPQADTFCADLSHTGMPCCLGKVTGTCKEHECWPPQ